MTRLFGTDGIRGTAGEYPLTVDMVTAIGRVVAGFFAEQNRAEPTTIIVGKDTRESGDMLASALCAGICSMGVNVCMTGVMPTPGVAFLTLDRKADAGIVLSASHNPYMDNGIKIFHHLGYKLSVAREMELETRILSARELSVSDNNRMGRIFYMHDAVSLYADFLNSIRERYPFDQPKLVVDCANGAVSGIAEKVFPEATVLFNSPDGKNINNDCGSEYPRALCRKVVAQGAAAGFAFDGDGDRVIAADEKGSVISGDRLIAVCAAYFKEKGLLKNNTVVTTVMSNIGLTRFLREQDIAHLMTDVGDRHVLEKMLDSGAVIGGEDSGHIIFSDYQTTGDGMLTALMICGIMAQTEKPLSELVACMTVYPQELVNVPVREKTDLDTIESVQNAIKAVEADLGESGRVLVRYSGTQPLCRVMVEAGSSSRAKEAAGRIVEAIRLEIGSS